MTNNVDTPKGSTTEQLLLSITEKPRWLQPKEYGDAELLKDSGFVSIGLASGQNPPRNAWLTPKGIVEKTRLSDC